MSETWVRVGETRRRCRPRVAASQRRTGESEDDKATIEALRRALSEKLPSSSTPQKAPDGSVLMASGARPSASARTPASDRGERQIEKRRRRRTTASRDDDETMNCSGGTEVTRRTRRGDDDSRKTAGE